MQLIINHYGCVGIKKSRPLFVFWNRFIIIVIELGGNIIFVLALDGSFFVNYRQTETR